MVLSIACPSKNLQRTLGYVILSIRNGNSIDFALDQHLEFFTVEFREVIREAAKDGKYVRRIEEILKVGE